MKTMKSILLSLFVVSGVIGSGEQFRTDINPALLYYRAFQIIPDLSQADRDYLFANEWRGQKLPGRFGGLVDRYGNELKLAVEQAGATVRWDWGIHLGP